jgi:putative ABC transport system ATP-binding protein
MVEARGVTKVYADTAQPVHALRGVDLRIARGELVALMGPSGSGKSSLLHLLGALDTPTAGEVLLEGRSLGSASDAERTLLRRERLGFVFQAFHLLPLLTLEENVAMPFVIANRPAASYRDRVRAALAEVGLDGVGSRLPAQASGGQQQRAAIARALVHEPAVVLADEPTGALDRATAFEVMALFRAVHGRGQTIVVVTHDPEVASYADRVVLLRDGLLVDTLVSDEPGNAAPLLDWLAAQPHRGAAPVQGP